MPPGTMSVRLTSVTVNTGSVTGYRGSELTVACHSVSLKKKKKEGSLQFQQALGLMRGCLYCEAPQKQYGHKFWGVGWEEALGC